MGINYDNTNEAVTLNFALVENRTTCENRDKQILRFKWPKTYITLALVTFFVNFVQIFLFRHFTCPAKADSLMNSS